MNARIEEIKAKFQPFNVIIEITTVQEARILWHKLNINLGRVQLSEEDCVRPLDETDDLSAFYALDDYMIEHKLKKDGE